MFDLENYSGYILKWEKKQKKFKNINSCKETDSKNIQQDINCCYFRSDVNFICKGHMAKTKEG